MTIIYHCIIELHDNLYFATREIGRLYETEAILHNYALCYGLGLINSDSYRYFCGEQIPQYQEHLTPLNEQNIYVTPAQSIHHHSVLNTWKYANNNYHVKMEPTRKNIPSFGRVKEIAPESKFQCFIISEKSLTFPKWIRLGKWMSKAEVKITEITNLKKHQADIFTSSYPLNPLDIMFTNQIISYDVINMPPVSLIRNVTMRGEYYYSDQFKDLKIPVKMKYTFQSK